MSSTFSQFFLIFLFSFLLTSRDRNLVSGLKCYACSWPREKFGQNGRNCSHPTDVSLIEECKPASATEGPPFCSTMFNYKKQDDKTPILVGRLCINYPLSHTEEALKKAGYWIAPDCTDATKFPTLKLSYNKEYYDQICLCKSDVCNSAIPSNLGPPPVPATIPAPVTTSVQATNPGPLSTGLKCYSCNFHRSQSVRSDGWRQKDCHSPTDEDLIDCTNRDGSPSYCMTFVAYEKPTATGQPTFYLTRDCWAELSEGRPHKMCDISNEPVSATIVYTQIGMYHHECICNTTGCNGAALLKAANVTYT